MHYSIKRFFLLTILLCHSSYSASSTIDLVKEQVLNIHGVNWSNYKEQSKIADIMNAHEEIIESSPATNHSSPNAILNTIHSYAQLINQTNSELSSRNKDILSESLENYMSGNNLGLKTLIDSIAKISDPWSIEKLAKVLESDLNEDIKTSTLHSLDQLLSRFDAKYIEEKIKLTSNFDISEPNLKQLKVSSKDNKPHWSAAIYRLRKSIHNLKLSPKNIVLDKISKKLTLLNERFSQIAKRPKAVMITPGLTSPGAPPSKGSPSKIERKTASIEAAKEEKKESSFYKLVILILLGLFTVLLMSYLYSKRKKV